MSKKRVLKGDVCILPLKKRFKGETLVNNFQKLIFTFGYKFAQKFLVNSYLRVTFNSCVIPVITNIISQYYCQVKHIYDF